MDIQSIYDQLGGNDAIRKIVDTFYPKVYANDELRPLFQGELEDIKRKQWMFLTQLTGGGPLYSDSYGPPNMRARHLPFEITPKRAQTWLMLMEETLIETELMKTSGGMALFERLRQIAPIMVNSFD